jgi:hypothetical protein
MFRKHMIAGVAAVVAFGLNTTMPTPASATPGTTTTFVFTAGATVSSPMFAPGLGPSAPVGTAWLFDTANPGFGGQRFCWGTKVMPNATGVPSVGAALSINGVDLVGTGCRIAYSGTLGAGLTGLGVFCGNFSGSSNITGTGVNIGVGEAVGATMSWVQSAGTVAPYTITGGPFASVGGGLVQETGAAPGTCGVGGGTTAFAVTGFLFATSTV